MDREELQRTSKTNKSRMITSKSKMLYRLVDLDSREDNKCKIIALGRIRTTTIVLFSNEF
jgi:hypothetical protein